MTQTKINSWIEAMLSALLAAPTAIFLHKSLLTVSGTCVATTCQDQFVGLSWMIFLGHSIIWKYIIRRLLVHYNCENITSLVRKYI